MLDLPLGTSEFVEPRQRNQPLSNIVQTYNKGKFLAIGSRAGLYSTFAMKYGFGFSSLLAGSILWGLDICPSTFGCREQNSNMATPKSPEDLSLGKLPYGLFYVLSSLGV